MDPIADLLTCIRNANQALKPEITVPHSNIKESAVKLLKEEGYLDSYNAVSYTHLRAHETKAKRVCRRRG